MFGEMAAIDGEERSASIIALDDSRLLAMSRADFRSVIQASPDASMWLLSQMSAHLRVMTERVFELSALNVQSRLHCELLRMAARSPNGLEVRPAPTHAELANRIGTHREAVTREMRALTAQNIIKTGRRRIEFLDIARLQTSVGRLSPRVPQGDKIA
jgi:CRP-like cAMP-binding protein